MPTPGLARAHSLFSSPYTTPPQLFQLAAMASIYLAIKVHSKKKVSISSIASTGNGIITVDQIEAMEYSIMNDCLDWHINPGNYKINFGGRPGTILGIILIGVGRKLHSKRLKKIAENVSAELVSAEILLAGNFVSEKCSVDFFFRTAV